MPTEPDTHTHAWPDLDGAEDKARHHFHAKWVQPTVLDLVAQVRLARTAYQALVRLHDSYDGPDPSVRGQLARILLAWDGSHHHDKEEHHA